MSDNKIVLPSKPKVVSEEGFKGRYEIDGLYPGYGHTLGNSLRRIILSSLEGAAITSVKIDGVSHEFSVIDGIKEDVISIILNLKKVRLRVLSDEEQTIHIKVKGPKVVTAADIDVPGQVEILNPEHPICEVTGKTELNIEMKVSKGLGYLSKEILERNRVDIGEIVLDASFTPIRRVTYEVENTRVGDRTDFNKLSFFVETDGTMTPREAFENSIEIMIHQLKSIIGFKEEEIPVVEAPVVEDEVVDEEIDSEVLKTRIESLDLSSRTLNALTTANIRTVGGLVRKKEEDILEIDGLGNKGLEEIKDVLTNMDVTLKA
jgi:DNA-directed RNA polymerase subunit alpha